jgi:cytochrome b6-f complex iron-sulfur subunit
MMTTFALVVAILLATIVAAAAAGRWWLRRLAMTPVRPAMAGAGGSCDGCPGSSQTMLMAAADGGGAGGAGGGGSAPKKRRTGPDRRTFLRGALGLSAFGALGGFGAASLAFLWPDLRGGFGAIFEVDNQDSVLSEIDAGGGKFEYRPARALLVRYDPADDPEGQYAELTDGQSAQVMALYQTCVHLGCTVPWCETSKWWECPCHGSQYNRWGEWQDGPAPRGLDRFRTSVDEDGTLLVDTSEIITGPARQEQTLGQAPEGPHCV